MTMGGNGEDVGNQRRLITHQQFSGNSNIARVVSAMAQGVLANLKTDPQIQSLLRKPHWTPQDRQIWEKRLALETAQKTDLLGEYYTAPRICDGALKSSDLRDHIDVAWNCETQSIVEGMIMQLIEDTVLPAPNQGSGDKEAKLYYMVLGTQATGSHAWLVSPSGAIIEGAAAANYPQLYAQAYRDRGKTQPLTQDKLIERNVQAFAGNTNYITGYELRRPIEFGGKDCKGFKLNLDSPTIRAFFPEARELMKQAERNQTGIPQDFFAKLYNAAYLLESFRLLNPAGRFQTLLTNSLNDDGKLSAEEQKALISLIESYDDMYDRAKTWKETLDNFQLRFENADGRNGAPKVILHFNPGIKPKPVYASNIPTATEALRPVDVDITPSNLPNLMAAKRSR